MLVVEPETEDFETAVCGPGQNISPYLIAGSDRVITNRTNPLDDVPDETLISLVLYSSETIYNLCVPIPRGLAIRIEA